jgi:DNA-binding NarL/FixJ family response regulator
VDAAFPIPIRVCALESQPIVAQGLSEAFARHGGLTLAAWCNNEAEVPALIGRHLPRLLLVDPTAAGGNLLALAARISAASKDVSLLIWSEGLSPAEKRLVGGLGMASVVERDSASNDLIQLCLRLGGVEASAPPVRDIASDLERGARRLTPKEAEVARLASSGLKNREIAASMGIAQGTVKVHLMHVFEKTGLRDRQQLCGFAQQLFGTVTATAALAPAAGD